jgi:hypothetical protein
MVMKITRNIFFIIFIYIVTACEESVDRPIVSKDTGLLIVDGILTNEKKSHSIRLTLPYKTLDGDALPATGANVIVFEENTPHTLNEFPARSGIYVTPEMRAVSGKIYTLLIDYRGKQYTAVDSSVAVEPLQKLTYQKSDDQYSLVHNPEGTSPNFIGYVLSWKHTDACIAGTSCEGVIMYYDLKTIDVNEIFKPAKADFFFPLNTIVIRKKYSVSRAYKAFLRAMLSETEWRGGLFDVDRAGVPTNLSEGAAGFFAVSTVVSDTTVIQ